MCSNQHKKDATAIRAKKALRKIKTQKAIAIGQKHTNNE